MTDEHWVYSIYASITDICAAQLEEEARSIAINCRVETSSSNSPPRTRKNRSTLCDDSPSLLLSSFFFSFLPFLSLPSSKHCLCYHSFSFLSLTLLPFYSIHFLLSTVCEIILFSSRLFSSRPLLSFPPLSLHLCSFRLIPFTLLLSSPIPSIPSSAHPCSCQQH